MTQLIYDNDNDNDKDKETKEFHLKRLEELSLKSLGEIPILDKPTYEQEQWIARKVWRVNK